MHPTPYPAVNAVLLRLLADARAALQTRFVGLYLYGSLASGDFNPHTSDVDFVVVTDAELPETAVPPLRALHAALAASSLKWAAKLEGTYVPRAALRRYDPDDPPRPTLNKGAFYLAPHGADWVIQRHILRESGVVVAGPAIRPLIDPVPPAALQQAVCDILQGWWAPLAAAPQQLQRRDYQAYAILSMCRALQTLETGVIASKPAAARWAQSHLPPVWTPPIAAALAWRPDQPLDLFQASLDLIQHALERSARGAA